MRFLVFDTQEEAQAAVDMIDTKGRSVYAAAGYTIAPDGSVIGKSEGEDSPEGVTRTWDIPRQRLDGKWVVVHPENFNMANYMTPAGVPVKDFVMDGISAPAEEFDPNWLPQPADQW